MGLLERLLHQESSSKDDSNQFLCWQAFETNDRYDKMEDWADKFNVVTGIINNITEETDECIRFQNEIENKIKKTNLELESRIWYKDTMLRYNRSNFEIFTKQHEQLREASKDLIAKCVYKFNEEEEVKNIRKLRLLDELEGMHDKVSKNTERIAKELKEDTESLGMIEKEIKQVKSRLQQLEAHRLYTENMMEKNIAVMADLVKQQRNLLLIAHQQSIRNYSANWNNY